MPKKTPHYAPEVQRHAVEQVLCHRRPIAQVARQLHCSTQSVQRWIKRHCKVVTTASVPSSKSPLAFLPIQVEHHTTLPFRIELVTKNGLTLRFPVEMPSDTLCNIVRQLEIEPC